MACRIRLDTVPDAQQQGFLRALAEQVLRLRETPELWQEIQRRAKEQHDTV